jgi:hypothetical protein
MTIDIVASVSPVPGAETLTEDISGLEKLSEFQLSVEPFSVPVIEEPT